MTIQNQIIQRILEKYKTVWALAHVAGLADWDRETYMPEAGIEPRGEALATLSSLIQSYFLDKNFIKLIDQANAETNLSIAEKAILRVLNRQLKEAQKLPPSFVEELERTTNQSQVVWRNAKLNNDFVSFKPFLQKIIELNIRKADYLGYEDNPYDALLDLYEEGLTTKQVDKFFDEIKVFLSELLNKITSAADYQATHELEHLKYDVQKLEKLGQKTFEILGTDPNRMRLDISAHPFSKSMLANKDIRITTRIDGTNFKDYLCAAIHEFGHGLYEQQSSDILEYTPIRGGVSLGIHESQSRFWENLVGRNMNFLEQLMPEIHQLGPEYKRYSLEDIFSYFNLVKPSLIRVEADEVTYHFHIMIRFELEKAMLNKELTVDDVAEAWNEMYQKYLGIRPTTDSEGILQDIHWSMGAMGYFPTYSTGTVLSATWKQELEKINDNINELVKSKEGITKIKDWLRENIHQYGSTYTFNEIINKITESNFSTEPWKLYLQNKYII